MKDLEGGDDEKKDEEKIEEDEEKDKEEDMEEEPLQIPTPDIPDFEEFDGAEDVIDLRAYQILGGIYHFNLCQLPPQPKVLQDCTLTKGLKFTCIILIFFINILTFSVQLILSYIFFHSTQFTQCQIQKN